MLHIRSLLLVLPGSVGFVKLPEKGGQGLVVADDIGMARAIRRPGRSPGRDLGGRGRRADDPVAPRLPRLWRMEATVG